ncbi:MAG TPA: hypothetical protein VN132_00020, partial [Bdellovibrio sp.]|nr:hypothetical protein [Bdellovibrio sp.]
ADPVMATLYIWIFSFLRRPRDFFGGPHSELLEFKSSTLASTLSCAEALQIFKATLPPPLAQAKSLKHFETETSFFDFFCSRSVRSIPFSVSRSLCEWQNGFYPLTLMTHVPTATEVMILQTEGRRCVSLLIEKDEIQNFVLEGRDVLGFLVHDLIHADHFFHNRENALRQIHFAQKMSIISQQPYIETMLARDSQFRTDFQYLMSDMNSVPLHLLKSLKAILLGYYKRRDGLSAQETLSSPSEKEFVLFFDELLATWSFSTEALLAARRLNTTLYQNPQDSFILDDELRPRP